MECETDGHIAYVVKKHSQGGEFWGSVRFLWFKTLHFIQSRTWALG